MVKIMEKPMNKWMIWGVFPYFWKHPCRNPCPIHRYFFGSKRDFEMPKPMPFCRRHDAIIITVSTLSFTGPLHWLKSLKAKKTKKIQVFDLSSIFGVEPFLPLRTLPSSFPKLLRKNYHPQCPPPYFSKP